MSNLFNLSALLESNSPELVRNVFPTNFLSRAISIVESYDKMSYENKKKLYSSIMEADSVKEENDKFADFFKDFKKAVECHMSKIRELASTFNISLETFADANKELTEDTNVITLQSSDLTYTGVEYQNLLNEEIPCIDPYKEFKAEFGMLGKLLQDIGPLASDEQRATIVATVCNNLAKKLDDDWLGKAIKDIACCDECGKDDFAKTIYNKFVASDSTEITVDIGTIRQSKLSILNYKQYANVINTAADELCEGFAKVGDEVGSLFFRNQDGKFSIITMEEGVADKTYHFNKYGYNQINKFITAKISQMDELFNLYLIALSIKMDCIYKFMEQCRDIIILSSEATNPTQDDEEAAKDDAEDTSEESSENDYDSDLDNGMDDTYDEVEDETSDDDSDESDNGEDSDESEEPEDDSSEEEVDENTDDVDLEDDSEQSNEDIETECYLFEADMHMHSRLVNYYSFKQSVYDMMHEDANDTGFGAAAKSALGSMKEKVARLVEKVKEFFTQGTVAQQIENVVANQEKIKAAQIPDSWTIQKLDVKSLNNFSLAQHVPNEEFKDEDDYISKKYATYFDPPTNDKNSLKDRMLGKLLSKNETKYTDTDRNRGLDWILKGRQTALASLEKLNKQFETTVNNINKEANATKQESAMDLFTEDSVEGSNPQPKPEAAKSMYENVNAKIIAAISNIYTMKTKKELKFLIKLAPLKPPSEDDKKEEEKTTEEKTEKKTSEKKTQKIKKAETKTDVKAQPKKVRGVYGLGWRNAS